MTHRMDGRRLTSAWRVSGLAAVLTACFAAPAHAGLPESIVHVARVELAKNVHEMPNGSNEAPAIKRYRKAVRWSSPRTAWCGYFVSYVALKAGAPIGESGQGIGAVDEIRRWAKRTKRWRTRPHKGNIAVFRGHVGIVERVVGSRWIVTIEGNHSNRVARVWRSRSEPRGYVQLSKPKPAKKAPETSGTSGNDAGTDDSPVSDGDPAGVSGDESGGGADDYPEPDGDLPETDDGG
jgi:CHAP domain